MNARDVLTAIRELTKSHPIAVANKMAFLGYETGFGSSDADYVAVTSAGEVYEFEIKVSRADYLRDRGKSRHRRYEAEGTSKPNRFWYVTPAGIVRDDLPSYAGHFELNGDGLIETAKAPRIYPGKHEVKTILRIARAMRERGA